jgi:hypothetical protein
MSPSPSEVWSGSFPNHDAHTAQWAGLKGKQNPELLRAAEIAGCDVLLTVDQGLPHQQGSAGRELSISPLPVGRLSTNRRERYPPNRWFSAGARDQR